jgi:hypothetical protein
MGIPQISAQSPLTAGIAQNAGQHLFQFHHVHHPCSSGLLPVTAESYPPTMTTGLH